VANIHVCREQRYRLLATNINKVRAIWDVRSYLPLVTIPIHIAIYSCRGLYAARVRDRRSENDLQRKLRILQYGFR
jgi:hypothetical protein